MQIVSRGDSLHEMPKLIFWENMKNMLKAKSNFTAYIYTLYLILLSEI